MSDTLRPVDIVTSSAVKAGINDAIESSATKGHVHPIFAQWLQQCYGLPLPIKSREFLTAINARILTADRPSFTRDADKADKANAAIRADHGAKHVAGLTYVMTEQATVKSTAKLARLLYAFACTLAPSVKGAPAVNPLPEWAVYKAPTQQATSAPAEESTLDDAPAPTSSKKAAKQAPAPTAAWSDSTNALIALTKSAGLTATQRDQVLALAASLIEAAETCAIVADSEPVTVSAPAQAPAAELATA